MSKKDKIRVIPEEGEIDPENVISTGGECFRGKCNKNGKGTPHGKLKRHFQRVHTGKEEKIRVIPEEGEIDPENIFSLGGKCFRGICNNNGEGTPQTTLKRHFILVHTSNTHQYRSQRGNKLTVIPTEGDIEVKDVYHGGGYCFRDGCNGEFKGQLKEHFRTHLNGPRPPPKLTEIPKEVPEGGEIDPKNVFSGSGSCSRPPCKGGTQSCLKRHFKTVHLKIIEMATCEVCGAEMHANSLYRHMKTHESPQKCSACNKVYRNVTTAYDHIKKHHKENDATMVQISKEEYENGQRGIIKVIPSEGEINWTLITSHEGYCLRGTCNSIKYQHLKDHYLSVHSKVTATECPDCGRLVPRRLLQSHKLVHTDPQQCSLCPYIAQHVNAGRYHLKVYHENNGELEPLTEEEIKEYKTARKSTEQEKKERQFDENLIRKMGSELRIYEAILRDPKTDLHRKAQKNMELFNQLFRFKGNERVSFNAHFVAVVDPQLKIPKLVMETRAMGQDATKYHASTFHADPKLQLVHHPKREDFHHRFHRGHLAPAANALSSLEAASSYYYSNIVPMAPKFNLRRLSLERIVRDEAKKTGIWVFHVPIMGTPPQKTTPNQVGIPEFVALIMINMNPLSTKTCSAWKIANSDEKFDLKKCEVDGLQVLQENGIHFKCNEPIISITGPTKHSPYGYSAYEDNEDYDNYKDDDYDEDEDDDISSEEEDDEEDYLMDDDEEDNDDEDISLKDVNMSERED